MSRLRWSPWLLIAVAAIACAPATTPSHPSAALAPSLDIVLADVPTYKGDMARSGEMPGPGPADKPVVLWEIEVATGIAAAPLIVGGQVVVAGQDGIVRGLAADTGDQTWSVALPAGVVSTPTIAGGTLYVITDDGVMRTVSLTDRSLGWTASGFVPQSILTATADLVLAGSPGEIVALRMTDGSRAWRAETGGSDRAAIGGDTAFVGGADSGLLTAIATSDGTERWSHETGAARVLTPAAVGGQIYVAGQDVPGRGNVIAAFAGGGDEVWRVGSPGEGRIGGHAVAGDHVIVSIDYPNGGVHALDRASGDLLWSTPLDVELVSIPLVADGVVYVAGTRKGAFAVDVSTGAIRWRATVGEIAGAAVAVSGGLVLVTTRDAGGGGRVLALADPADSRVMARPAAPATPSASATAVHPPLHVISVDAVVGPSALLTTAVGPDGTMFVGDIANSRIVVRKPDGALEDWGGKGADPGEFDFSIVTQNDSSGGVSVSPDGALIAVGDGGNHRVQLFDADRRWLRSIGRLGREDGQFINPSGVTVDSDHNVWVVDVARGDVQVFDEAGTHRLTFGAPGRGDGELSRPGPAFVRASTGEVFIPDFGNRRVSVFSNDGTWLRNYGGRPADGFFLGEVNCVAVDPFGRLFVLDTDSRIFILDHSGALQATLANELPDGSRIDFGSFALDAEGRIYLADIGGGNAGRLIIAQLDPAVWPGR
jgi:outer membrane protein assembly factor BamB